MNLTTAGIDLARDSARIAAERSGFIQRLDSQSSSVHMDALRHLVGVREGFKRITENAQAHTPAGLYDGFVNEDVNVATGYTERVSYGGGRFLRVLYDEKDVPVGAYEFKVQYDTKNNTTHFDAFVVAPGDNGEMMQVQPDGSTNIFQSPGNFFEHYSKKWFRLIGNQ